MADSLPPRPQSAVSLPPRPQPAVLPPPGPQPAVKMCDCSMLNCWTGLSKIFAMMSLLFTVGLTADSYQYNLMGGNPLETSYLALVIIVFIASVIWNLLLLIVIPVSDLRKKFDLVFYLVAGLFLIASAAVWFVSVDRHLVSANGTYIPLGGGDINFDRRRIESHGSHKESVKSLSNNYYMYRRTARWLGITNGLYINIAICLFDFNMGRQVPT